MDKVAAQLLNRQLSYLQVQLLNAKLSRCTQDWRMLHISPTYNKLYYIRDGEGWVQIGNELFYPRPGELMLIPGGVKHSCSTTGGTPYTKYWCHFKSNINFGRLLNRLNLPCLVQVEDAGTMQRHFEEMIHHYSTRGPTASIRIQAALFSVISLFLEQALANQHHHMGSAIERKLIDSLHYIDAHLAEELTIEQLSLHAHFHPNYFIRMFKKHMGTPPMKYIHERRLEKAQQLLASTELTVGEVAGRTGFNDVSYFSAAFKKHTGATPSDYRNIPAASARTNR
ncbi:helix-turn-helix domain-containing protein [Paenibacillus sp. H1-7]|uniref:AraC family transcriptional regulator n=1 Tax=Paenibacillus sp. H1-7 TaxID=2282849 RepID=UPI001EF8B527|nr:helix-turn-helix domain-containing protein [Paenibacillus sp. H1-7]